MSNPTYQIHSSHALARKPNKRELILGKRPPRADQFLNLLRSRRQCGRPPGVHHWPEGLGWVSLPEVQRAAGARYGARLGELRKKGHKIEQVVRKHPNGEQVSWYRLVYDAERDVAITGVILTPVEPVVEHLAEHVVGPVVEHAVGPLVGPVQPTFQGQRIDTDFDRNLLFADFQVEHRDE